MHFYETAVYGPRSESKDNINCPLREHLQRGAVSIVRIHPFQPKSHRSFFLEPDDELLHSSHPDANVVGQRASSQQVDVNRKCSLSVAGLDS